MKKLIAGIFIISMILGIAICIYGLLNMNKEKKHDTILEAVVEEMTKKELSHNEKDPVVLDPQEFKEIESLDTDKKISTLKDSAYGIMQIPKINIKAAITKGIDKNILRYYIGMYETTDTLGVIDGNTAFAAHTMIPGSGQCSYCWFSNLERLSVGDEITIDWYDGNIYSYKVIDKKLDKKKDSDYAFQKIKDKSLITLVTCSNGDEDYRDFIIAELFDKKVSK